MFHIEKTKMVTREAALPGRGAYPFQLVEHALFSVPLADFEHYPHKLLVGMGCFWGAERLFWQQKGVLLTAVGYSGGYTPYASYDEVCSGQTGHAEVVAIAYDPNQVALETLLAMFWENHDPTQGMRQGNDVGTQYRSAIYLFNEADKAVALNSQRQFQAGLAAQGYPEISTEIELAKEFYFAEPYHQQYLEKNPGGYCGLKGTGVSCIL
ncbi:MAG: peptide-methionine (S)-S-oxide reductase [Oceanospirillum sp.]|nr:peptide-methionine (S)-S-oxide reductase [Oceanospirillum sp.]